MGKEIIITRRKSKSIMFTIWMLLSSLLMLYPIYLYYFQPSWSTSNVPVFVVVIAIIILPILLICGVFYFKQIFNNDPVLIVNSKCNLIKKEISLFANFFLFFSIDLHYLD